MCPGRFFFFFQAEDGIRDYKVTGVQTCALPILLTYAGQFLIGKRSNFWDRRFSMTSWHAYCLPSRRVAGMLKRVGGQGFRILRRSVFLAVKVVHLLALGQYSATEVTACILGTVRDSSGAVLINTQVTATN